MLEWSLVTQTVRQHSHGMLTGKLAESYVPVVHHLRGLVLLDHFWGTLGLPGIPLPSM